MDLKVKLDNLNVEKDQQVTLSKQLEQDLLKANSKLETATLEVGKRMHFVHLDSCLATLHSVSSLAVLHSSVAVLLLQLH